jgi:murein DD-endopeptidase MepM/ murein hydrolase activator NlpD
LLWPVKGGAVARGYADGDHRGVDISAPEDSGVRAAADGIVVFSDQLAGYGHTIILLHPGDWVTVYARNRECAVKPGQRVLRGEWIARVGSREGGADPHLHFEWRIAGRAQDPEFALQPDAQ